ncbi:MAG TPA: DUF4270 domain-containing protein [Chitinophagaceae bacterium]|mgnify:CR=1 FL=1|nr:DUF4270 domain-containing protein [Chitinophagaceae bacterium]
MKQKNAGLLIGFFLFSTLALFFSCKKLNDATTLGGGLIPPVDNIHTFDTTIDVQAFNDTFSILTDTAYYGSSYTQYLGHISNDPFFGRTDAKMFLELKPSNYRYTFLNRPDSLHLDSIVLILDYVETYGDTITPQLVSVYEIPQYSDFGDTAYIIRKNNYPKSTLLGSASVIPATLDDSVKVYKDTTARQLRIRLDDAFGNRLLQYDTTAANGRIPAYISDSAFRKAFKGFALESTGGNALMGFNLSGANTKLAIYYKDDNGDKPVADWDTAVAYFAFNSSTSAAANYVERDHNGSALAASVGGTTPDDVVYIQNTPGSFAWIKIPGLAGLSNRVVHRAELIMEQIYDVQDSIFPPGALYLDAYDAAESKYVTVPYDLLSDFSGNFDLTGFGVSPFNSKDPGGNSIKTWRFNISRYVQNIVNDRVPVYDLRLFAPFYVDETYMPSAAATGTLQRVYVNTFIGKGRVRLHGGGDGSQPSPNPQRMRLRIVYSKI